MVLIIKLLMILQIDDFRLLGNSSKIKTFSFSFWFFGLTFSWFLTF